MKTITFDETAWKLVPLEPDLEMGWVYLDAARQAQPNKSFTFSHAGYRAMIAATPAPPQDKQDTWLPIASAPRDGTNILLRFGKDGSSQGKYIPGIPYPWQFIDTANGISWLINQAVDGAGGPSHWMRIPD